MAVLTTKMRKKLPEGQFGIVDKRTQQLNDGNLSAMQKAMVDAKAHKMLGRTK